MPLILAVVFSLLVTPLVPAPVAPDTTWPQFRGHAGRAVSTIDSLPLKWSTSINVAWSVPVAGRAWSSPIVWGDQVIVTSAVGSSAFKEPSTGIFGNDYVAELAKQGMSEEQIERLHRRQSNGRAAQQPKAASFVDAHSG